MNRASIRKAPNHEVRTSTRIRMSCKATIRRRMTNVLGQAAPSAEPRDETEGALLGPHPRDEVHEIN